VLCVELEVVNIFMYWQKEYWYFVNSVSVVSSEGWTDGDFSFHVVYLCFLLLEKLKVKAKFGSVHWVLWFITLYLKSLHFCVLSGYIGSSLCY